MSIGIAIFTSIGNRTLGLNDTRRIVSALAAAAPSLGDLGVGGISGTNVGSPGAYASFVLPGGDQASIAKGEFNLPAFILV